MNESDGIRAEIVALIKNCLVEFLATEGIPLERKDEVAREIDRIAANGAFLFWRQTT